MNIDVLSAMLELEPLPVNHPVAVIIKRMGNGGYYAYEFSTDMETGETVLTFTHASGDQINVRERDIFAAFKKALDAGIAQTRARQAGK